MTVQELRSEFITNREALKVAQEAASDKLYADYKAADDSMTVEHKAALADLKTAYVAARAAVPKVVAAPRADAVVRRNTLALASALFLSVPGTPVTSVTPTEEVVAAAKTALETNVVKNKATIRRMTRLVAALT